MNRTCIIVADAKRARFFGIQASDAPRHAMRLVERSVLVNPGVEGARGDGAGRAKTGRIGSRQSGDTHPGEPRRPQQRLEVERRFGREIAREAGALSSGWKEGAVVLIAEPRLLGLARDFVREALNPALELKELAKNYTQLTASELRDQLDLDTIVSGRRPRGG